MKIMIISLLLCFQAVAQDFIPIKKGDDSPLDGYVISVDTEKKLRQKVSDLEFEKVKLNQLGVLNNQEISLYKEKSALQSEHNKELRDELKSSNSFFRSTGYFILGGLIASVVAFSAARAVR